MKFNSWAAAILVLISIIMQNVVLIANLVAYRVDLEFLI